MGPIHQLLAYSRDSKNIKKQFDSKRVDDNNNIPDQIEMNSASKKNSDSAQISSAGINMFNIKTESVQYINMVQETNTIDDTKMQEIRERILSDYYSDSEVIDIIINNMASMPNYIAA